MKIKLLFTITALLFANHANCQQNEMFFDDEKVLITYDKFKSRFKPFRGVDDFINNERFEMLVSISRGKVEVLSVQATATGRLYINKRPCGAVISFVDMPVNENVVSFMLSNFNMQPVSAVGNSSYFTSEKFLGAVDREVDKVNTVVFTIYSKTCSATGAKRLQMLPRSTNKPSIK